MVPSSVAIHLIKGTEGNSKGKAHLHTYVRPEGLACLGWGHVLGAGWMIPLPLSYDQAHAHLMRDLERACNRLHSLIHARLDQHHIDALCCWAHHAMQGICHSLGDEDWENSRLIRHINEDNFILAAAEFDQWCTHRGKVFASLVNRRMLEKKLFSTGEL